MAGDHTVKRSSTGFLLSTFMPSKPTEPAKSISMPKRRVFPSIALSFSKWSRVMMLKLPVGEAKMSAWTRRFQWLPPGNSCSHLNKSSCASTCFVNEHDIKKRHRGSPRRTPFLILLRRHQQAE